MAHFGPEDHARKAHEMWLALNSKERYGVKFGLFPHASIEHAKRSGFNERELCSELMRIDRTYRLASQLAGPFPLGKLVATPGAIAALERWKVSGADLLRRHASGDWGDLDQDDKRANDAALRNDARILSAYNVGDGKLWIITEADRSSTCLLLPSEY